MYVYHYKKVSSQNIYLCETEEICHVVINSSSFRVIVLNMSSLYLTHKLYIAHSKNVTKYDSFVDNGIYYSPYYKECCLTFYRIYEND